MLARGFALGNLFHLRTGPTITFLQLRTLVVFRLPKNFLFVLRKSVEDTYR